VDTHPVPAAHPGEQVYVATLTTCSSGHYYSVTHAPHEVALYNGLAHEVEQSPPPPAYLLEAIVQLRQFPDELNGALRRHT
jgi:hypothetical protein